MPLSVVLRGTFLLSFLVVFCIFVEQIYKFVVLSFHLSIEEALLFSPRGITSFSLSVLKEMKVCSIHLLCGLYEYK